MQMETNLSKYVIHGITSIGISLAQRTQKFEQSDMEKRVRDTGNVIFRCIWTVNNIL